MCVEGCVMCVCRVTKDLLPEWTPHLMKKQAADAGTCARTHTHAHTHHTHTCTHTPYTHARMPAHMDADTHAHTELPKNKQPAAVGGPAQFQPLATGYAFAAELVSQQAGRRRCV